MFQTRDKDKEKDKAKERGSDGELRRSHRRSRDRRSLKSRFLKGRYSAITVTSVVATLILVGLWYGLTYYRVRGARNLSSQIPERPHEVPVQANPPIPSSASQPQTSQQMGMRRFEPRQSRNIRSTYSENVLYLENYVNTETGQEMRRRWAQEVNKAAISEWKLDAQLMPHLLLQEKILVEDLERIRMTTPATREQEVLERMRARESAFMQELNGVFKNRAGVDRYLRLKRSFLLKIQNASSNSRAASRH
jgi:hypothetical protein